MFKEFIKWVIDALENLHNLLNEAYEETYGCEDIAYEVSREIKLRQRRNKDEFIAKAMAQVTRDILKKDGYLIPPNVAGALAERLFQEAQRNNDIDELNNLIIKEE